MRTFYTRIRNGFFVLLILSYIIFEELIWKSAVIPIIRFLISFHLYQRFLDYIRFRAGRFSVLILFMVPFAIGEVIGTASAVLAAQLHFLSAGMLYVMKIPLIVIALGILQNGKEKLLSYPWFSLCYGWVMAQLDKLYANRLYRQLHIVMVRIRKRFFHRSNRFKHRFVLLYRSIRYSLDKN